MSMRNRKLFFFAITAVLVTLFFLLYSNREKISHGDTVVSAPKNPLPMPTHSGDAESTRVLQSAGPPLKNVLATFSVPKDSDLETAQHVYKTISRCFKAADDVELADGQMLQAKMPNLSEKEKNEFLARAEKFLKRSKDAESLCEGVSSDDLLNNIYPSLLRAAQLGDEDAAVCYVRAMFPIKRETLRSQDELQNFHDNAQSFIQKGFEKGDWKVVNMLLDLYGDSNTGKGLFFKLAQRDPAKYYRYAKLLSLGAIGEYKDIATNIASGEATLISPGEVESGDEFANRMYQTYFVGKPLLTSRPDYPCQFYYND